MKKIMSFFLSLASVGIITFSAETKAAEPSPSITAPQVRIQIGPRRRHARIARSFTQTRVVRRWGGLYRETYLVRYSPYGGTRTRLISRVRIR